MVVSALGQWERVWGGGLPVHVYPLNDLREHATDGTECWCGAEEDDEGIVVHNSADGREAFETGERKPS